MALQPLLGPGLPRMTSPFFSVFCSWYACVCVCVCVCVYMSTTFRFGCAKCQNHILSQSIQGLPHYYYTIHPIPYAMELELKQKVEANA